MARRYDLTQRRVMSRIVSSFRARKSSSEMISLKLGPVMDSFWAQCELNWKISEEKSADLVADEIIARRGVALRRPALGAPIFDVTGFAHEGLEAFALAHGGVGGMPEERIVGAAADIKAGFSPLL